MADQNQNQITGNIRTLKTDLEVSIVKPQDRLQQAGNFVQARPTDIHNNMVDQKTNTGGFESTNTPSTNNISDSPSEEKKDVPAVSVESKSQQNYSWSNMSPNSNSNNSTFIPKNQSSTETKSGFSVLDDSIDLPLENDPNNNTTPFLNKVSNIGSTQLDTIPPGDKSENNNQANQFDINSLNLQDDTQDIKPKKQSSAGLISAVIVIVLLGLIGGGVYFYLNMSSKKTDNKVTTDKDNNVDIDNSTDINENTPKPTFESPLTQDSAVDIAFNDIEPIRRTISTFLADKSATLIQLNLTKDDTIVSLIDIADIMGINIPSIGTIEDYRFYAYNQQGVYKLVAVLGLDSGQDAKTFVENWSNSIPRDLAGFSINLPSRIVNSPEIKNTSITNNSGQTFDNYYYNYTSPNDSIDVSSYENFVLIASSQDSMRYILNQIR
jgi:hypothetical protein